MRIKLLAASLLAAATFGIAPLASAATSLTVVRPSDTQGWTTADTRPGGTVTYVASDDAPAGEGALRLMTSTSNDAKAQYLRGYATEAERPLLSSVTSDISYFTKQNSASFDAGSASFQIPVFLNGTTGFTTLVFEPYVSEGNDAVENGVWQQWDVDAGKVYSTRSVGTLVGSAGSPTYTFEEVIAQFPNARVLGFGVNVGTFNPSYDINVDTITFNGTTYDFEQDLTSPTNKEACKNGGWDTFTIREFKNQGDCVSFVASGDKANGNPANKPTF